jgi:hypothetical protein
MHRCRDEAAWWQKTGLARPLRRVVVYAPVKVYSEDASAMTGH